VIIDPVIDIFFLPLIHALLKLNSQKELSDSINEFALPSKSWRLFMEKYILIYKWRLT
jgi:hypothetical protein